MKKYVSLLLVCFLIPGCAKQEIIDRIKIVQSIGLDVQGDTYKSSISYASYDKKKRLDPITAEALTLPGVWLPQNTKSDDQVVLGQVRTIVISEKLARKSISDLAVNLLRDPTISNNAAIVISKPEISTVISKTFRDPPFYLAGLIKQNMEKGNTPLTNAHYVLDQFYGDGQDVYVPVLNLDENGLIFMDGLGVFKDDKLRLFLTEKESLLLKLLKDKPKSMTGSYEFKWKNDEAVYFRVLHGRRKILFEQNDHVTISLKLYLQIKGLPKNKNYDNKSNLLELEQDIKQHLTNEIEVMLKKFQMNDVDPIGFGEIFRSNHRNWNEQEFKKDTYSKLYFEVNPEIVILYSGVGVSAQ